MTHTNPLNKHHPAVSISIDKRIWVWFNGIGCGPHERKSHWADGFLAE